MQTLALLRPAARCAELSSTPVRRAPTRTLVCCSAQRSEGIVKVVAVALSGLLLTSSMPEVAMAEALTNQTEGKQRLADLCKTGACRELMEQAEAYRAAVDAGLPPPDFRPKTEEERRERRRMRYARQLKEIQDDALKRQIFARDERAYVAKAQVELFEFRTMVAEGVDQEEATTRAKAAGELAFEAVMRDINGESTEKDAYEKRLAEKRAAAAEAAKREAKAAEREAARAAAAAPRAAAGDGGTAGASERVE